VKSLFRKGWFYLSKPIRLIFLGTCLCLLISFGFVEVFGTIDEEFPFWKALLTAGLSVAILAAPAIFVAYVLRKSFGRDSPKEPSLFILASFLGITLVFAGLYYSISVQADFYDAAQKFDWYENQRSESTSSLEAQLAPDIRAFRGVETRFWSGVDWPTIDGSSRRSATPVSLDDMLTASGKASTDIITFQPVARWKVFFNSLHYSVTTVTTLGRGDITPARWYTRLASDLEVVIGLVLLVVALPMLLGNRGGEPESPELPGITAVPGEGTSQAPAADTRTEDTDN
jgi:hypothetical protein